MSTRSGIGYITEDGKVKSVYCHFDGYPEGVGKLLTACYNDLDSAKAIVALGSLSHLDQRLNPIGEHSFEKQEEGTTVAYHRDRGESLEIQDWPDADTYLVDAGNDYGADYLYLFAESKWFCYDPWEKEWIDL